jgi:Na+/H+-dicarboxylate symporter/ABC-type amino acid transport substrate-binding protein
LHRIGIGAAAGAATGVFLGERAAVLQAVADGFVKLLQMAVLPYLTVSVMATIGGLSVEQLRRLGGRLALVIAGLWGVTLAFAFLLPLILPPAQSGAFFSTTLLERAPPLDLVDLYIPANPFFALANNVVPAVVLFSIVVGAALIGLPNKQVLLETLTAAADALARVMRRVTALTPYGVFAIVATATGTLRIDEATRLQIYLLGYAMLAALLALWVLPGIVSALTPIPAREVVTANREALLTATIAGDLFIVLPMLVSSCRELVARHVGARDGAESVPEAIVPIAYNFPHGGKILTVNFILFAGWFSDAPIDVLDYPRLALSGLVTLFGSTNGAVPFLLDLFRVPADTFQLYLATSVINARVGSLVAAMHMVAVALLGTCAVIGVVRWRPARIAPFAAATLAVTVVAVGGTRLIAATLMRQPPSNADVLDRMAVDRVADEVVMREPGAAAPRAPAASRLEAIAAEQRLRVGYLADSLPFAYFNADDTLVGFDVALMHDLARELGVRLQFAPVDRTALEHPGGVADLLQRGDCDIVIGGMAVTVARARLMQVSEPYLSETLGFVVRDEKRRQFESWSGIRAHSTLTIAVPAVPYFMQTLRQRLPGARLMPVDTAAAVFTAGDTIDAIAMPAERGSAWTLRYPQYAVVVPAPDVIKVPLAFAMPRGEPALTALVNTWIGLKRSDGTIQGLYDYWILGRAAASAPPRWSIIRDVLHWVK